MKKILVTGVSKGIGKAIAAKLLIEGYFVFGTYNSDKNGAENLLKDSSNLRLIKCDFENSEELDSLINELKKEQLDGIINNAGVIIFESWNDLDYSSWQKTFQVNLNAPLRIVHGLRNNLNSGASIVNISSTDGLKGAITSIAYSASKAALINLTMSLANVFSDKKIRVNSISPGFIGDGMSSPAIKDAKWINPLARTGKYEEIAEAGSFLLSEKSSFVNGTNFIVDGGTNAVDFFLKKESELI